MSRVLCLQQVLQLFHSVYVAQCGSHWLCLTLRMNEAAVCDVTLCLLLSCSFPRRVQGCSNPLAQLEQCHSSLCVHKCLYTLLCFNIIYSLINTSVLAACKILSHKDLPSKNVSASQSGCKDKYVACIIGLTFNALMSSFTFSSTLHAIGQVKSVSPASFMLYGMLLACSCTATALRAPLKSQLYCVVLVSTRSPAPEWEFVAYWMPGRDCP
jgi:hypothetical protein